MEGTSWLTNRVSGISGTFPYSVIHESSMIRVKSIYLFPVPAVPIQRGVSEPDYSNS